MQVWILYILHVIISNVGHGTCAPSRASLMTGRFPTRFGYEFTPVSPLGAKVIASIGSGVRKGIYHPEHAVGRSYDTMTFPTDTITLPKVLKKAGYRTLHFGKWHLGTVNESKSINQGFDETLDFGLISLFLHPNHPDAVNCRFEQEYLDRFLWATVRYVIRKNNGPLFRPAGYMTDYLADEASKAIIANKDHPFFLYFALNAVHSPLQALRSDYESVMHIKDHCSRVYAAMIISLDRAVGKLLRTLSEHNLTDDTIIIFTSDNGAPNYISEPDVNLPFRGWKATLFEGGIRVPFLMQWPKNIPGGIRSHAVVSHTDIFATALSAAGIEREGYHLDGTDLMQNIKPPIGCENISEQYPHHCAFTTIAGDAVKRVLYWKSGHYSAIRYGEWKLQMAGNPQKTWLFNLKDDPTEQHNLANIPKYSAVLKDLIAVLRSQEADQQAEPIWRSVSETPIAIDFTTDHQLTLDDEYVYWPN